MLSISAKVKYPKKQKLGHKRHWDQTLYRKNEKTKFALKIQ